MQPSSKSAYLLFQSLIYDRINKAFETIFSLSDISQLQLQQYDHVGQDQAGEGGGAAHAHVEHVQRPDGGRGVEVVDESVQVARVSGGQRFDGESPVLLEVPLYGLVSVAKILNMKGLSLHTWGRG